MQKKLIYITVGLVAVASTCSFYFGKSVAGRNFIEVSGEKVEIGKEKQSTQIAIVNQDDGTEYKDKTVNYANDLLKSVENDFVLTNRESAQSGVKDGKYAAIVILPGNFSQNITSINDTTPSKVEIYYEVNNDLDEINSILVSSKISEFEKELNNKLSLMYVTSILDELHTGQDYIADILKNDNKDLEAINSVNNIDLLKGINLTELEQQNINLESLDLSKNFEENKEIMNQMDKLYREKMILNDKNMDKIRDKLLSLISDDTTGVAAFRKELEGMTDEQIRDILLSDYSYDFNSLAEKYEINVDEINKFIEELPINNGKVDDIILKYRKELLSEIETKGNSAINQNNGYLNGTISKMNEVNSDIDNVIPKVNTTNKDTEETNFYNRNINSLNQEYLLYGQIVEEIAKTNPEIFESAYTKVMNGDTTLYNNIFTDIKKNTLDNNTYLNSEELKNAIKNNISSGQDFIKNRSEEYIKNELEKSKNDDARIKEIETNLNEVKEKVNSVKQSSEDIQKNEDYKYLADMFSKNNPLEEKLKIKELLTDENAEKRKEELVGKVKENNKTSVEDTKDFVKNQIEKNMIEKGVPNGGNIVKLFDERYMNGFNSLVDDFNSINKTMDNPQNDEQVSSLWNQYYNNNEEANNAINNQINQYRDAVLNNKQYADNHIQAMKNYLDEGIKVAEENVNNSIKDAKKNKQNTYNSNKEILSTLSGILSNTRVGTVENKEVYNFIANPTSAVRIQKVAAQPKDVNTINSTKSIQEDKKNLLALFAVMSLVFMGSKELLKKYIK